MVSICMITYGHEKFIKQAVEGVLMQECDFNVELIIADDASTDNTEHIVKAIIENVGFERTRGRKVKQTATETYLG